MLKIKVIEKYTYLLYGCTVYQAGYCFTAELFGVKHEEKKNKEKTRAFHGKYVQPYIVSYQGVSLLKINKSKVN